MSAASPDTGMQVRDLMSTEVVTVPDAASVAEATDRLLANGVGSVVVVDGDENPCGIVTESDVLRVARETDRPLTRIDVGEVGHPAVVTTSPSRSIAATARLMADEGVKKVPVVDGIDLVGMITLTDIVWHLSSIRQELAAAEAIHDQWSPN